MTYKLLLALALVAPSAAIGTMQPQDKAGPQPKAECPSRPDCRSFPKAVSADEAFLHLQIAIGALNERARFDETISTASRTAVYSQINELQEMFRSAGGAAAADPDYVENLDLAATAIMGAAEEEDPAIVNETLDLLQRDFQLKLKSARATMGAEGGKPKTIPVFITTLRGTVPIKGYRIKLADGLRTKWPPTTVFEQLSAPAAQGRVTPGVYLVYAYLGNAVAGKELLDIGLTGATSAKLDLQVK